MEVRVKQIHLWLDEECVGCARRRTERGLEVSIKDLLWQ